MDRLDTTSTDASTTIVPANEQIVQFYEDQIPVAQLATGDLFVPLRPLDILRALTLSQATVRKMKQNLVWASVYTVLAIPVAAGVLYPSFGIMLRPEWSALLMALSSIIVAVNAVLLKRVEGELGAPGLPARPGVAQTASGPA